MNIVKKSRRFRVLNMKTDEAAKSAKSRLLEIPGVLNVDTQPNAIRLDYDLMRIRFSQISARLAKFGFPLKPGYCRKLRSGWIHFIEKNEFDNMSSPYAPCCANPQSVPKDCKTCHENKDIP